MCFGFFLTNPLHLTHPSLTAEFSGAASIQAALAPTSPGYLIPRVKGSARVQKSLSDKARVRRTHPTLLAPSGGRHELVLSSRVEHICVAVQSQALNNKGGRLVLFYNDMRE